MATNTYVALDKVTVGTATPSITFSSISGSYTDLVLVMDLGAGTAGVDIYCQVNGDTATNYSHTRLTGNGTAASSSRGTSLAYMRFSDGGSPQTTANSVTQVSFMNYSNTTTYKTALNRASNGNRGTDGVVNLWRSTAAITSITVYLSSGNITAGSTFSLYGIKAEPQVAKATGGTITYANGYWVHTFTSSGTFTPNQALTCDYLVVAGGGGGGRSRGGGGGAGGFRTATSQTLTATGYAVTVGAGGAGGTSGTGKGTNGNNSVLNSTTSSGGGGGGGGSVAPSSGGSGGGGFYEQPTGASGNSGSYSPVEGYAGGTALGFSSGTLFPAAGGGGAGAVGGNPPSITVGGNGGNGASNSYSGSAVTYAGGGGGAVLNGGSNAGDGGTGGGGGASTTANVAGTDGTTNTGGGGGGGYGGAGGVGDSNGGAGGSGIVIIRYPN